MRGYALLCLGALAACGPWPDAGGPPMARSAQDWPELLPLDAVIDGAQGPAATDTDNTALLDRATALQARAAILRRASVTGGASRTSALGSRAETLRGDATDLEDLRARLDR